MNPTLNYKNILLKHKQSIVASRAECDISTIIAGKKIAAPVFCANMPSILTYDIAKQFDRAGWFHIWNRDLGVYEYEVGTFGYVQVANKNNFNFVSISIGTKERDRKVLEILKKKWRVDSICVDVALIYNKTFEYYLKWIRQEFPTTYLIAGNCSSYEAVKWLEDLGYDCAKINIGVSNACRTKQNTGFSSSTVTDLMKITNQLIDTMPDKPMTGVTYRFIERPKLKIKVIADGGLTQENGEVWIGDIAKAMVFGADFVMSGSLFANCLDSPALINGYSGNSTAQIKGHSRHIEGTTLNLQSNGLTIRQMMQLIEDSLKSSVSYAGGKDLSALKTVDYQIV